jgi:hypothetical protein
VEGPEELVLSVKKLTCKKRTCIKPRKWVGGPEREEKMPCKKLMCKKPVESNRGGDMTVQSLVVKITCRNRSGGAIVSL